jgi:hypothetical protein
MRCERLILAAMSSHPAVALTPRSIFGLIGLTFTIILRRLGKVLGITWLVLLPLLAATLGGQLANIAFAATRGGATDIGLPMTIAALCLGGLALLLGVCYPLMEGALTHNVIEHVLGRDAGIRASFGAARPHWRALWVSNVLRQGAVYLVRLALGFFVGMFAATGLFTVPAASALPQVSATLMLAVCGPLALIALFIGGLLALNWVLRAPAIIGEGQGGFEALQRSNSLVGGHRWRLGLRYLPLAVVELLTVSLPAALVTGLSGAQTFAWADPGTLTGMLPFIATASIASALISLLAKPWQIVYTALNYLDLRTRKENLSAMIESAQNPPQAVEVAQAVIDTDAVFSPPQQPGLRIAALTRRLRLDPDNAALHRDLAEAYTGVGDIGGAIGAWSRYHELMPAETTALLSIARLQLRRRDRTGAAATVASFVQLERDPQHLAALNNDAELAALLPQS